MNNAHDFVERKTWSPSCAKRLLGRLFPCLEATWAGRILDEKKAELERRGFVYKHCSDNSNKELLDGVRESYEQTLRREEKIDDKAKSGLFVIALAVTFGMSSLSFLKDMTGEAWYIIIVLIFAGVGVLYFMMSSLSCMKAVGLQPFYYFDIRDRIQNDGANIFPIGEPEKATIERYYKYIRLDELITTKRANYLHATLSELKRGIVFIILFFLAILIGVYCGRVDFAKSVGKEPGIGFQNERVYGEKGSDQEEGKRQPRPLLPRVHEL